MGLFMFGMATPLALAKLSRYQVVLLSLEPVSLLPSFLHCESSAKCPDKGRNYYRIVSRFILFLADQLMFSDTIRRTSQPANGPGDS